MSRTFSFFFVAMAGIALAACSHSHSVQGQESASEIPEGIRVGIGGEEIKEGDKVNILRSVCKYRVSRKDVPHNKCRSEKVGEASVLKVLDQDSAIVRPDAGVAMDNTMTVEKQ